MERTILAQNIAMLRAHLGDNQEKFAARLGDGVPQSYISKWENQNKEPSTRSLARMAALAGVEIEAFMDQPWSPTGRASSRPLDLARAPEQPLTVKSEEGSVGLKHLDLSLSMGDGTNLEDHYEEGVFEFDAALLRTISRSPPNRLVIGQGIGDSMQPTLYDRDMIMFDTTQTDLTGTDRIWAISLFGAGGVKRLRPIAHDRVLVMSDNPAVKDQEVSKADLRILGRVIWSARRH